MPSFTKGPGYRTPFGKNEFLRSTQDVKTESRTVAASTVAARTIDGFAGQKVLQPGTVLALITSGDDEGKVGPFQDGTLVPAVNEVQTITRTATGGTVDISFYGGTVVDASIVAATTAAQVKAILVGLPTIDANNITVAGSAGGPFEVTFVGNLAGTDVALIVIDDADATGGTVLNEQTTAGSAASATGAETDGREDPDNIVGVNGTFLPWQLTERDVEVAVVYEASVVQANCIEYSAADADDALSDETAAHVLANPGLNILFK